MDEIFIIVRLRYLVQISCDNLTNSFFIQGVCYEFTNSPKLNMQYPNVFKSVSFYVVLFVNVNYHFLLNVFYIAKPFTSLDILFFLFTMGKKRLVFYQDFFEN